MSKRRHGTELKKAHTFESREMTRKTRIQKIKRQRREIDPFEEDQSDDASLEVSFEDGIDSKPAFKIKLKTEKSSPTDQLKSSRMEKKHSLSTSPSPKGSGKKKRGRGRESGTSSDEERWLDAIESGKLEEVDDELKKIKPKDPKMMTARQRAMYDRGNDKDPNFGGEVLLSLPSGYKTKVMTAEAIQKAAIKAQKRKQLADEKREKDKKTTMDRLLKKQDSKIIKPIPKTKLAKKSEPLIVYRNTIDRITVTFPPQIPFPLVAKANLEAPKPVICGIGDCTNLKRYSCSQTKIPLCSLECYKKNMHNVVVS